MKNWLKVIVGAIVVYGALWGIFIYGYGNYSLIDTIVPEQGIMIDEWLESYYFAGIISIVFAFVCNMIWNWLGLNYAGEDGIQLKHNILWALTAIIGLISAFFVICPSQAGAGLSILAVFLIAPLGFYIVTLFFSANAVRYIPPLASKIHS